MSQLPAWEDVLSGEDQVSRELRIDSSYHRHNCRGCVWKGQAGVWVRTSQYVIDIETIVCEYPAVKFVLIKF